MGRPFPRSYTPESACLSCGGAGRMMAGLAGPVLHVQRQGQWFDARVRQWLTMVCGACGGDGTLASEEQRLAALEAEVNAVADAHAAEVTEALYGPLAAPEHVDFTALPPARPRGLGEAVRRLGAALAGLLDRTLARVLL